MKSKSNVIVLRENNEKVGNKMDGLKWGAAIIILLAMLAGNYYYAGISFLIRLPITLIGFAVAGFIAAKTQKGQLLLDFFKESRTELRKVIWPTRQETMQTTLVVGVMVVVLALFLWGVDGIFVWLIGWLTGQI